MRRLIVLSLVAMMFTLSGCVAVSNCPPFPEPDRETVIDLQKANSDHINAWVVELFKLQKKLEVRE